jgi:PAS domain S-box-containing protein
MYAAAPPHWETLEAQRSLMRAAGPTVKPINVLYLAPDGRETKLVKGAFDRSHPQLNLDFTTDGNEVRRRLREPGNVDALLVGWSVAEPDALALIAHVRQQGLPVAIIAAGDQALERYSKAGADECVTRGTSFLARLPDAVEVAVGRRQAVTAKAADAQPEAPKALRVAYAGDIQFVKGALAGGDRSLLQLTPLAQALADATAGRPAIDVVVLDHGARDANTSGTLAEVKKLSLDVPVVLLVDPPDETTALRTFEATVAEFLVKTPGWTGRLASRLGTTCARHQQLRELESLRQREARLRTLVDTLPASLVRLSGEGAILAMNAVALSFVGAGELRQVLRKPFQALVTPDCIDLCTDFVKRVAQGDARSIEFSLTTLTGEGRFVEAQAVPVPPEDGRPGSILMVLRDCTERKRLEITLELREEEAREVAASQPAPVEPAPAADPTNAVPTPAVQAPSVAASIDAAQLRAMESDLTRLCGQARSTFEGLEEALRGAEAHHDAELARHQEAFARLETEQRERWRSYDAFVEAARLGIFQVDDQGAIVEANPAFAATLGYGSAPALIQAAATLSSLTETEPWTRAVEAWRGGAATPVETRWKRADGALLALRLTARPRARADAAGTRLEVLVEDQTTSRAVESHARRARRWEDVARLTTGIAADLRGAVDDVAESAQGVSSTTVDEAGQRYVAALQSHVGRARDLSRQLVAFGRRGARVPEPLDLNVVVRELEPVMRRLIDEPIELAFELAPSLALVEAERYVLEEVLVNLAVGADDALPAGGLVRIGTVNLDVTTTTAELRSGEYVAISLTAQGWGISTISPGTSTGVVAAQRAIGRLGGTLAVAAVSDESVTFTAYLPQASVAIPTDDLLATAGLEAAPNQGTN